MLFRSGPGRPGRVNQFGVLLGEAVKVCPRHPNGFEIQNALAYAASNRFTCSARNALPLRLTNPLASSSLAMPRRLRPASWRRRASAITSRSAETGTSFTPSSGKVRSRRARNRCAHSWPFWLPRQPWSWVETRRYATWAIGSSVGCLNMPIVVSFQLWPIVA